MIFVSLLLYSHLCLRLLDVALVSFIKHHDDDDDDDDDDDRSRLNRAVPRFPRRFSSTVV